MLSRVIESLASKIKLQTDINQELLRQEEAATVFSPHTLFVGILVITRQLC